VLTYFSPDNPLMPTWPQLSEGRHVVVVALVYAMLLAPKLMGILGLRLAGARAGSYGGAGRFGLSFLVELALSVIYAPILMVQQMIAVFRTVLGIQRGWAPQMRDGGRYGLGHLAVCHGLETGIGAALTAGILSGLVSPWLWPIALSLVLAVPLSAISGVSLTGALAPVLGTREMYREPPITRAARAYRNELKALLDGQSSVTPAE